MPELPDITLYIEALEKRTAGAALDGVRLNSPFLLRTALPPLEYLIGKKVTAVFSIGKRIVLAFEDDLFAVLHLMIAGRLHWKERGAKLAGKSALAAFDFSSGTLLLTEAGTKRRASLHLFDSTSGLQEIDPGGLNVLTCTLDQFSERLQSENHTLKRALTDPRILSGIGNSYSDEILWQAKLSPAALTSRLSRPDLLKLFDAVRTTLTTWTERLRSQTGDGFPEQVIAFRPEMAVHGRYQLPCPRCGSPVQRIRYADNETDYCVTCQTGGKLLSDRALSRLLGSDWPKTLDALESLSRKYKTGK